MLFFQHHMCILSQTLIHASFSCTDILVPTGGTRKHKVLKEMLHYQASLCIAELQTQSKSSLFRETALLELKLNCENNDSTDQILVLPSLIGVRQCHVKTWPSSSFPQNLLLAEHYAGLRSNQPMHTRTHFSCIWNIHLRSQSTRRAFRPGRKNCTAIWMHCLCCRVRGEGKNDLDFGIYHSVPVMQSSPVSGTWTQSNRCHLDRPNNKSVEGLSLHSINPEKRE